MAIFGKVDGTYVTCVGPCVSSNTLMLAANNATTSSAFANRLAKCRLPEIRGYEFLLRQNQIDFIQMNKWFYDKLAELYHNAFDDYTDMITECLEHYADPHVKRAERIQAVQDMYDENLWFNDLWFCQRRGIENKLKKADNLKPGKTGRQVGNLKCPASLQGFRMTDAMKQSIARNIVYAEGGMMFFCKSPSYEEMLWSFTELIQPSMAFFAVFFSDDSCMSIRRADGSVFKFNLDIASCDMSHTPRLFQVLVEITHPRVRKDMQRLVDQCNARFEVISLAPRRGRQEKVVLQPRNGPKLQSGSTLTTTINDLATMSIILAIVLDKAQTTDSVIGAAANAGYIVTVEECFKPQHLQFLKHSPVYDNTGTMQPLLNVGVFLRASGTCYGDLPGDKRTPLKQRGLAYQAGLIQGFYPRVTTPFLTSLRRNAGAISSDTQLAKKVAVAVGGKVGSTSSPSFSVEPHEFWSRYDLDSYQVATLESDLASCTYGDHYQSSATCAILSRDYGLDGRLMETAIPVEETRQ